MSNLDFEQWKEDTDRHIAIINGYIAKLEILNKKLEAMSKRLGEMLKEQEPVKFEDLPREEQIDMFIQQISGNKYEDTIALILAAYTARKIYRDILNLDGSEYDGEEKAWDAVINALGANNVYNLIENIKDYVGE